MTEPTRDQRRCMIYRHVRRLEDACDNCGQSIIACAANLDINREPCCGERCTH